MKITKQKLIRIIKDELEAALNEEYGEPHRAWLKDTFKFNDQEVEATMTWSEGGDDDDFTTPTRKDLAGFDISPYDMLLKHYGEMPEVSGGMPYGTQTAETGDPFNWLDARITREFKRISQGMH